ncbi:exonuclease subunit SbcC [Rivularia sp. UHCC 0363]|uniref:exonuclease subunit SbcC n=1 Tax=Rivularia sp. UHCC 0363 TaxID=3110244 RepID=UPI002B1FCBED|nr:exonuclease subunit SbcC [Rivularia sp. UHCC 0363]MEA5592778.1 exonuclease subunit SbcC [Rivularia sp. UHCC 0363]
MIPVQITLQNFLSYQDASLDFSGLHTACICGSNGAGKSSLLEAITWAVWGESRATSEDDVIHTGAKDVRVDFTFEANGQIYRVIRTRRRGSSSALEFQIETPEGFKSLTGKGLRGTQDEIFNHIKLDYDTFINSAYLRQGRADEFMLKRPNERKEILAELLKLNQYDELEERAKELSRQLKARGEEFDRTLESKKAQLQQQESIAQQRTELEAELNELQKVQAFDNIQLQSLQVVEHQRQGWEEQLHFVRQQYTNLTQDSKRLESEQSSLKTQLESLERLLDREAQIKAEYANYQTLQSQEEAMGALFAEFTRDRQLHQQKQQQLSKHIQGIERQLQQSQAQLEALEQQEQDIQQTLNNAGNVEAALEKLKAARQHLSNLDNLQMQVSPLLLSRQQLQTELHRTQAGIVARIEQLQVTARQLQSQSRRQPQLQQAVIEVETKIEQLDKDKIYLQRVQEKGQERRHFMERLQAQQREYERLLGELDQKLQMLQNPDAVCPLCERPLDEHHWNRVADKTKVEFKDTQGQLWVFRDQMAVSEREIQVLRQEYRSVNSKLSPYEALREQKGELAAQLQATSEVDLQIQQIAEEKERLEKTLNLGDYAPQQQSELQELEEYLQQLNYSEQNHALARSEVEKWRWAEIKQGQIKDAQKRQAQLAARKPQIQELVNQLEHKIKLEQTDSEIAREIKDLENRIAQMGYDNQRHNQIRIEVRQAQSWHLRYQQLVAAQQQHPEMKLRSQSLQEALSTRLSEKDSLATQINSIVAQLEQTANPSAQIQNLEQQLANRRRQLDDKLGQLGRLQQQSQYLDNLKVQYSEQQQQLKLVRAQQRVYQELAQAFGKNGIQALMIENVLPQLEAETNKLLSRLSANQLHVQFITQRAGKTSKAKKKNAKLIDTLDIVIADARGTRAYETYSGGEAFRINFAIRLALAKLLAQRAGAALQLLIVDEGFGTQDSEGCDRLIAAINAIAPDFACILTVTHMPHLKEAFAARIEVNKTQDGSTIQMMI